MAKLRRFLVEVLAFTACLLIGAAVFQALEYKENEPANSKAANRETLEAVVRNISRTYNITLKKMNDTVEQLRRRLMRSEDHWNFAGCYFFAGTVAFTIGFGNQAPRTSLGQLMVIIYALIAIPITGLMLSACGERLWEHQQKVVLFIEKKIFKREPVNLQAKTIAVNVFVLLLFFVAGSVMTKYYYDGWSMVEGFYFLWICMSTVGFGDYIINDGEPYYEDNTMKTIMLRFNLIFLIIGLCQVSCILVAIQNALETKFVDKVNNDDQSEGNDSAQKGEAKTKEEVNREKNDRTINNEDCELKIVKEEGATKISETSLTTL